MFLKNKLAATTFGSLLGLCSFKTLAVDISRNVEVNHSINKFSNINYIQDKVYRNVTYSFKDNSTLESKKNIFHNSAAISEKKSKDEIISLLKKQNKILMKKIKHLEMELALLKQQKDNSRTLISHNTEKQNSLLEKNLLIDGNNANFIKQESENKYAEGLDAPVNLHHVVYIFKYQNSQQDVWDRLNAHKEDDKWRGSNRKKERYFIYVGAYKSLRAAKQRAMLLNDKLGSKPIIYST